MKVDDEDRARPLNGAWRTRWLQVLKQGGAWLAGLSLASAPAWAQSVAMTGSLSVRGQVLPVGGVTLTA